MNLKLFENNILMFLSIACNFLVCCLTDFLFSIAKTNFADAADTPGFPKTANLHPLKGLFSINDGS